MAERPAVNASPLIYLARAALLDLLQIAGSRIVVPSPVAADIRRKGADDPAVKALDRTSWLVVEDALPIPGIIQTWDLGEGESSVLAWAYVHRGTEAILDDLAARRCAATLGIPVRGTLGLVLTAKRRGLIPVARAVLEQLRQSGMYLSDSIMNRALTLVDE